MASQKTILLTRQEYNAPPERNSELEHRLAALDADDGGRVPHGLAASQSGMPAAHFRLSKTLRRHLTEVVRRNGPRSQLSLRDRTRKNTRSTSLISRIAAVGTTIGVLIREQ